MATTVIIFSGHVLYITGAMFAAGIVLDVIVVSLFFMWLRKRRREQERTDRELRESELRELAFNPSAIAASGTQRKPPTSNGAT